MSVFVVDRAGNVPARRSRRPLSLLCLSLLWMACARGADPARPGSTADSKPPGAGEIASSVGKGMVPLSVEPLWPRIQVALPPPPADPAPATADDSARAENVVVTGPVVR